MKYDADRNGQIINREVLESRVLNYITSNIINKINDWSDYTSLDEIILNGYTGITELDDNQLLDKWNDLKEDYYQYLELEVLVQSPHIDDPLQDWYDLPNQKSSIDI
jgi:hypothetical protein